MQILAVPNWSFGREKTLLRQFREILDHELLTVHYCEADIDLNRTVTAFSGDHTVVSDHILRLAMAAFEVIDLNRHVGAHPRIGALDVCPLVIPEGGVDDPAMLRKALVAAEDLAASLSATFALPVFLYEKSERGRHEADLPSLRRAGFGGLEGREIAPDFGPNHAHPRLGVTVLGVRDFLNAISIDLATPDVDIAETLVRMIRQLRSEGDERFLGVRAIAFPLASREQVQVHLNLTLPDLTPIDPIVEWVFEQLEPIQISVSGVELIGAIRERDLGGATRIPVRPAQIIDF